MCRTLRADARQYKLFRYLNCVPPCGLSCRQVNDSGGRSPGRLIDYALTLGQQSSTEHKLLLLSGDRVVKAYSVALGSGGLAPKQREGDDKTPEGLYRTDYRNPTSRFHLALHISYPDETDKEQAQKRGVNPGGDIMIHGLGGEFRSLGTKHYRYDWTAGCIAVTDSEIEEIWRLVPDRTPVDIRP